MKLINKKTDYTIRAIKYLARCKGRIVPVKEIARALSIPRPFLRKTLQLLHKKGMVHACEGRGGGFTLAVPVEDIYLLDLIKIFQGPIRFVDCLLKKNVCPDIKKCILKDKMQHIEQIILKELETVTIGSLSLNR